jgi:hypothetical protein
MFLNLLKRATGVFGVLLLLATFAPMRALAADPTDLGKITIEVSDQNGTSLSGDWYLHSGKTEANDTVRNGSKGEVFDFPAGTYFLEVRNLKLYPFYKIFTANPQTLNVGDGIQFDVQYFQTEDQKNGATNAPVMIEPAASQTVPVVVTPSPAPAPIVTAPAPAPVIVPLKNNHIKLNIVRPVETDETTQNNDSGQAQNYNLATTGPAGLLGVLVLFSMACGLWIVKRKNA